MADQPLDHRFDPRFQRGYDPAAPPPPVPAAATTAAAPAVASPSAAAAPASVSREPTEVAVPFESVDDDLDVDFDDAMATETTPERNPYRLALLLTSVGLLVLAGATLAWTAANQNALVYGSAADSAQDWVAQQLVMIVPPAAIVAGVVGLIVWLALGAVAALTAQPLAAQLPAELPVAEPGGDDGD